MHKVYQEARNTKRGRAEFTVYHAVADNSFILNQSFKVEVYTAAVGDYQSVTAEIVHDSETKERRWVSKADDFFFLANKL